MQLGRPQIYETPESLQAEIDKYFEFVKGEKGAPDESGKAQWERFPEPITITGLCLALGFESRQSFYDYEKKEDFSYTIKKARMMVENAYEQRLTGQNVTGSIFALKNLGWEDRQKSELSGSVDVNKKPSWFDDGEQKTA